MDIDQAYAELRGLGYTGSLEDMFHKFFPGSIGLDDQIYAEDPNAGGLHNYIIKITVITPADPEFLLLEDGDFFLLENGDKLILEGL